MSDRSEWAIYDVRSNNRGTYYTLNVRTTGVHPSLVTVKHTDRDTWVCLTCLTREPCEHAKFAQDHAIEEAA